VARTWPPLTAGRGEAVAHFEAARRGDPSRCTPYIAHAARPARPRHTAMASARGVRATPNACARARHGEPASPSEAEEAPAPAAVPPPAEEAATLRRRAIRTSIRGTVLRLKDAKGVAHSRLSAIPDGSSTRSTWTATARARRWATQRPHPGRRQRRRRGADAEARAAYRRRPVDLRDEPRRPGASTTQGASPPRGRDGRAHRGPPREWAGAAGAGGLHAERARLNVTCAIARVIRKMTPPARPSAHLAPRSGPASSAATRPTRAAPSPGRSDPAGRPRPVERRSSRWNGLLA
jgi:hypothetical protein